MERDLEGRTWLLLAADGGVLARLEGYEVDQPWILCHFRAEPRFALVARLFAEELAILNRDDAPFDHAAWEAAYERIRALRLRLRRATAMESTRNFLLHVDGSRAWFRADLP